MVNLHNVYLKKISTTKANPIGKNSGYTITGHGSMTWRVCINPPLGGVIIVIWDAWVVIEIILKRDTSF